MAVYSHINKEELTEKLNYEGNKLLNFILPKIFNKEIAILSCFLTLLNPFFFGKKSFCFFKILGRVFSLCFSNKTKKKKNH